MLSDFCTLENVLGIVATATSIVGLLPQVYKSYRTKSTTDISIVMLINYLICSVAWVAHGACSGSTFVVYSNVVGTLLATLSIMQKVIYDKNSRSAVKI
ncbi:MAG: PQ-loop repeat-containing protein [Holosporaceae bacterium]|jgi:MtN3 and saliva related transmembrane protein|nr:PQ-loop repeat-containing protein [Holosporaceae bacterium]